MAHLGILLLDLIELGLKEAFLETVESGLVFTDRYTILCNRVILITCLNTILQPVILHKIVLCVLRDLSY